MSRLSNTSAKCLRDWNWKCIRMPSIFSLAGVALIPWSTSVFHMVHHALRKLPLDSFFASAVQFSSMTIIVVIAAIIWLLDKPRAAYLGYFLCSLIVAGSTTMLAKQIFGRSRPEWAVTMSKNKRIELTRYNAEHPQFNVPVDRVDNWFGLRKNRPYFKDRYASFPSGHSTGIFVIAAFLSTVYPAARRLWITLAISCALSRVYGERHYLEDVMVGGAIGWILALWSFSWSWPLTMVMWLVQHRACKWHFKLQSSERI